MEKKDKGQNEMSAATGASGDRVTLAVLSHQITALTTLQKEQHKEVIEEIKAIEKNIHALDTQQCIQAEQIAGIKTDIKENIKKDLEENIHPELKRLGKIEWAIGALSILGNSIAAWLGIKN